MRTYEAPGTGLRVELGRGERMLFTNRQWAVTNKVIEELHPPGCGYWIGRGRDLASVGHFPLQHMAEKDWVDLDAFIEARLVALKLWAIPADPKRVAASIERARRVKPTRQPFDRYSVFFDRRPDHWAFQIILDDTGEEWHSERPYATEDEAWSDALLAVRQVRCERRQGQTG